MSGEARQGASVRRGNGKRPRWPSSWPVYGTALSIALAGAFWSLTAAGVASVFLAVCWTLLAAVDVFFLLRSRRRRPKVSGSSRRR